MYFDFNEQEKIQIKNICAKIDSLNLEGAPSLNKDILKDLINEFSKAGYFSCEGPTLNAVRSKLSEKKFPLYFIFEIGIRFLNNFKKDLKSYNIPLLNTIGYIEKNNNFHLENINTELTESNGEFLINGEKRYVPFLDLCESVFVLAKKENTPCLCLIKKDDLDYEMINNEFVEGINFFNIKLKNIKVPKEHVFLYNNKDGFLDIFFYELNKIAISGAMGLMNAAFNEAVCFAKTHKNNNKPVIHYQEVGFKLAEMKTLLDASYLISSKTNSIKKIDKEAIETALVAKVFCLESLEKISSGAISILSIHGFFNESYAPKAYVLSKFLQVLGKSTEVSRVDLGDLLLGYKRF
ncbi:hypothetical protein JCM13304A_13930 [Desulfothermus okinawensis JCM 13304]